MNKEEIIALREEIKSYTESHLLPFWSKRTMDKTYGGFLTHFNEFGEDSGEDEKSLIAQTRSVFTYSQAYRHGFGGPIMKEMAEHGVHFLLNHMWDAEHGGFYWMMNRKGEATNKQKIGYGHSFAIYSLSEYTLATGDPIGLEYAEKCFDLLQKYAIDTNLGGYWEFFSEKWELMGPGSPGGDRKTLDVHMHLMEAFTTLYEASGKELHRRKLKESIDILIQRSCIRRQEREFRSSGRIGQWHHKSNLISCGDGIALQKGGKKPPRWTIHRTGTIQNLVGCSCMRCGLEVLMWKNTV